MAKLKNIIKTPIVSIFIMILITLVILITFNMQQNNKIEDSKLAVQIGKTFINQREYDEAIKSFDIALEKDKNNKEANTYKTIVLEYKKAKKKFDNNDLDSTREIIKIIDKKYKTSFMKENFIELKELVDNRYQLNVTFDQEIKKLDELYLNKEFEKCDEIIVVLRENDLDLKQIKILEDLTIKLTEGKEILTREIEASEKAKQEKIKVQKVKQKEVATIMTREQAISKLEKIYLVAEGYEVYSFPDFDKYINGVLHYGVGVNHGGDSEGFTVNSQNGSIKKDLSIFTD